MCGYEVGSVYERWACMDMGDAGSMSSWHVWISSGQSV